MSDEKTMTAEEAWLEVDRLTEAVNQMAVHDTGRRLAFVKADQMFCRASAIGPRPAKDPS